MCRQRRALATALLAGVALLSAACSDGSTSPGSTPSNVAGTSNVADTGVAGVPTERYDFGNPSPEEQQLWYLVNQARADPAAEGRRLADPAEQLVADGLVAFGIDTARLIADFAAYPVRPPVAWDPALARAAARHAADQAAKRTQAHRGSDGSRPAQRVRAEGVKASRLEETLSGYAHSPQFAHDAFQIDWGGAPPSGVQQWPRPGHRLAIMCFDANQSVTNVVGMNWLPVLAGDDGYGPNVVVQEFARIDGTFIVGNVWADANGNGSFDWGEGVGAVEVRPDHGHWFAVTAAGGGYVLPVDAGSYSVRVVASGASVAEQRVDVGSDNVLVDVALTPT